MDTAILESQIKAAMGKIPHPQYKDNLIELGMFGRIETEGDVTRLILKSPDQDRKTQIALEAQLRGLLSETKLPGPLRIKFEFDASIMPEEAGNRIKGVKNVIAIGSGKGGVGKSTVAANLAAALSHLGNKVGLMDADIYGPSIGKMFGLQGKQALQGEGNKIVPFEVSGLKLISFSFLLDADQAVIWRGPMLGKAIEQFLYEVVWGELDYLIIDLPPGTGDVQLSLAQLVDLDGAIIVTTPQNVALADASRAVMMFHEVKVPILGVIENMSSFVCPSCGHETDIFSKNGGEAFAAKFRVPSLGGIPLRKEIMESGENGLPIVLKDPDGETAKAYAAIAAKIPAEVEKYK